MHSPGVEVRPLVQINGDARFAEVFFTEVRVPAANVVGSVNDAWNVTMTRSGSSRALRVVHRRPSIACSARWSSSPRRSRRGDGLAADDPDVRRRVAQAYIETRVFERNTQRTLPLLSRGERVGPEPSMTKLFWAEMEARISDLAIDILGERGELEPGSPEAEGVWFNEYLYARASMIYAGTSEVQKNILAQRVLGLPRSTN